MGSQHRSHCFPKFFLPFSLAMVSSKHSRKVRLWSSGWVKMLLLVFIESILELSTLLQPSPSWKKLSLCWHHTDFSLEIHLSPCQPCSLCCMGRGSPDVFKLIIIISCPPGHGVCLSLGHVFLKREPQGFSWPCQTVVSTSAYKGRNSATCR